MPKYTAQERIGKFWSRVDKSPHPKGCWIWTGATTSHGYGYVCWDYKNQYTHRVSYEWAFGVILEGMHVLHSCDNPACVNPAHLTLGTAKDNVHDMWRKGRSYSTKGRRKLTDDQIAQVHARYNAGELNKTELAAEYGVSRGTIRHILTTKAPRAL